MTARSNTFVSTRVSRLAPRARGVLAGASDGAFWHGHPDYYRGQSGPFWDKKIAANKARDESVNAKLTEIGWQVIRLWDFEIERDVGACVEVISEAL